MMENTVSIEQLISDTYNEAEAQSSLGLEDIFDRVVEHGKLFNKGISIYEAALRYRESIRKIKQCSDDCPDSAIEDPGSSGGNTVVQNKPKNYQFFKKEKDSDSIYIYFYSEDAFFDSWMDDRRPKLFFKEILDINDRVAAGEDITIKIFASWEDGSWDFIRFSSGVGCYYNNLLFHILKGKKIVYIDSWCSIGSLVMAAHADEIIVGEFADVTVNTASLTEYPANMQNLFAYNQKAICLELLECGLLTQDEVSALTERSTDPVIIRHEVLKERAAKFNDMKKV